MQQINTIIGDYQQFLGQIFAKIKQANIDMSGFQIDHLAYRVDTLEKYEQKKQDLANFGQLISEFKVRNRPIAIFKLDQPLEYQNYTIPFLELPSPSPHHNYPEGLQHIEIIANQPLENIIKQHPNINFNLESINKPINPELKLDFEDGTTAKFVNMNMEKVIQLQASSITHNPK